MASKIAPAWRGVVAFILVFCTFPAMAGSAPPAGPFQLPPWNGPSPDFRLADADGAARSLGGDRAQITIVHFFATWCEPCREELPALSRLARRAGGQARVIAISVAEPDRRVRRFAAANKTDFPILLDRDRATARAWGVSVLPTSFVLDSRLAPRLAAETSVDWDRFDPKQVETMQKTSAQAP